MDYKYDEGKEKSGACQSGSLKWEIVMATWELEDGLLLFSSTITHCTEQDVTEQGDPNRVSLRVMPTVVKMQGWFSPRSAF